MQNAKPLEGVVVLEHASGAAAAYAGRLLSAMGAKTVMVEPPSLCPLRRERPFLDADGEESALFTYLATGKDSAICDLTTVEGRADFDLLAAEADLLIQDAPLVERTALGLDPDALAARHPHLVHVSALPFGAEGPKAGWAATDLTLWAAGGPLKPTEAQAGIPTRMRLPQAWRHAAARWAASVVLPDPPFCCAKTTTAMGPSCRCILPRRARPARLWRARCRGGCN